MPSECWKIAVRRIVVGFILSYLYTSQIVTMRSIRPTELDEACLRSSSNVQTKKKHECQMFIDKSDCNKNAQLLREGQYREGFLKYPTVENFEALCNIYRTWHYCNQTVGLKCNTSSFRDSGRTKTTILAYCTAKKESFLNTLNCLKTQSVDNHLFNGCFVMMMLKTDSCKNRNELLKCEDKLVRSACGSLCADFRLAVAIETWLTVEVVDETAPAIKASVGTGGGGGGSTPTGATQGPSQPLRPPHSVDAHSLTPSSSLSAEQTSSVRMSEDGDVRCLHEPQENPVDNSFEYTINCSPEFPEAMRLCYKDFFSSRVVFHPSMLAIVRSSVDSIFEWCNALGRYEDCISPIQDSCPEGVDQIYGVSFEWKKYYDVAVYICDTSDGAYLEHLPCFKKAIVESSQPSFCRELFGKEPSDQYMYQLKCHSADQNVTRAAFAQVDGLIKCYENFARKECSSTGRDAIYPLIRLHYSFDYLPLCFKPKARTTNLPRTTRRSRFSWHARSTGHPPDARFANSSSVSSSSQDPVKNHENNRFTKTQTQAQQVCVCPTPSKNTPVEREVLSGARSRAVAAVWRCHDTLNAVSLVVLYSLLDRIFFSILTSF